MRRSIWNFLLLFTLTGSLAVGCGGADEGSPSSADADGADSDDGAPTDKAEAAEAQDVGKADWTFDLCERRGWYGDGECDWFCLRRDPDCDKPALFADPSGDATKLPIVLVHGWDASTTNRWAFNGVREALQADGHTAVYSEAPPYDSVQVRAGFVAEVIDGVLAQTGAEAVNLICHSMGGLDCRFVASPGGLQYGVATGQDGQGRKVASITTISTAHQGTAVADVALGLMPGVLDSVINKLASLWGARYSDLADDSHYRASLQALSEAQAPQFNEAINDAQGVVYRSWAGVSAVFGIRNSKDVQACGGEALMHLHPGTQDKLDATLVPMAALAAHGTQLRPNDGMVTVESSKWGEFQGCIPADHLDEVGQPGDEGPDPHTGFDHLLFYRTLAFELAAQGL